MIGQKFYHVLVPRKSSQLLKDCKLPFYSCAQSVFYPIFLGFHRTCGFAKVVFHTVRVHVFSRPMYGIFYAVLNWHFQTEFSVTCGCTSCFCYRGVAEIVIVT